MQKHVNIYHFLVHSLITKSWNENKQTKKTHHETNTLMC